MNAQDRVSFWRVCVSDALQEYGGVAELQEIYSWVESSGWLGERDETDWRGRPMYQHSVRACIAKMRKKGELERVSRGRYRLTGDW